MKKIIFIIGLTWLGSFANAQNNINQYEYWFDSDFANRVTTDITPTHVFVLNTAVNATGLANGLHTFHIRFRDEDLNFSSVVSQFFQKVNQGSPSSNIIIGFEYWFDNNYAGKVSQTVTPQTLYQLNTAISGSQLAIGLHTFHVRFIDTDGNWSPTVSQFFQKVNPNPPGANVIAGFEYWFDGNYAEKVSQPVTPQTLYQLDTAFNANQLSIGLHTFHTRFVDSEGNWSPTVSQFFQKVNPNSGTNAIVGFEYWFDENYADRVTQTATPQTLYQLDTAIVANQLAFGLHTFHIRFKDAGGNWSSTSSQFFQKIGQGIGTPNVISAYRYWFDGNVSTTVNQTLNPPSNPLYLIDYLNLSQVDTGEHLIHLQFRDTLGNWSMVITDTIIQLGQPKLNFVTPDKGGNTGDVTVSISGVFFSPLIVRLEKQGETPIIVPDSLVSVFNGQEIKATFDLRNKTIGDWDLVVELVGDTVMVLEDGFEIDSGNVAQPWTNIIGFDFIRPNQWQNYSFIVGNHGNVDATGVPLWMVIPQNVEVQTVFPIYQPNDTLGIMFDTIVNYYLTDTLFSEVGSYKVIPLFVPKVAPSQTLTLDLKLRTPTSQQFSIQTWAGEPLYKTFLSQEAVNCYADIASEVFSVAFPQYSCLYSAIDFGWRPIFNQIFYHEQVTFGSLKKNLLPTLIDCVPGLTPGEAVSNLDNVFKIIDDYYPVVEGAQTGSDCALAFLPLLYNSKIKKNIITVASYDPNDKIGPSGGGSENYYNDLSPFTYIIHFENVDTATANAQSVLVLDTLDAAVFDFSNFQLGDLHIGDSILHIPPGRKTHQTLYNMVAAQNVMVRITANFNDTTGVASWLFESLDPQTLTPVANPFDGFLPPNEDAPEGEGAVHYSVKLLSNLPNNTLIKNKAHIYFDSNPPLVTEEWQNTLDNIKPHSQVDSLPAVVHNTLFDVNWNGIDTSSGIRYYNIYVSKNGGDYLPWLINVDTTSATFSGEVDSTYCFYSIATDSAGNVETDSLLPDACTTISCPVDYILTASPPDMDTVSASSTLTTLGAVTIASGYVVVFQAGTSITLAPGFFAQLGSDFTAYIEDCSSSSMARPGNSQNALKINIFSINDADLEYLANAVNGKVEIKENHAMGASFKVFDSRGNLVKTGKIEDNQLINLSDAPAGIYVIAIEVENQTIFKKVIKE